VQYIEYDATVMTLIRTDNEISIVIGEYNISCKSVNLVDRYETSVS